MFYDKQFKLTKQKSVKSSYDFREFKKKTEKHFIKLIK